jgi:hypothetical protein
MQPSVRSSFVAQFAGQCACCGRRFSAGTRVRYDVDNDLVIVDCQNREGEVPTAAEQAEARRTMCGKCYMVHAGECL